MLGCAPVIRFLVVQVPDASDMECVIILFRPSNGFMLCFEGSEHMVSLGFDHEIVDRVANGRAFGRASV